MAAQPMGPRRCRNCRGQGSLYLLVLASNSSIAVARGVAEWPGEIPLWGGLATMMTAATIMLLVNAFGRVEV
jgi:hypothetical protein